MQRSADIPWWIKIGAKIVLRRVPVPNAWWRSVGVFRHGNMDAFDYATDVVTRHLNRMTTEERLDSKTVLELGPGDGVATAVIIAALGGRAILIDTGDYADMTVDVYRELSRELQRRKGCAIDLEDAGSINDILAKCSSQYLTEGITSIRKVVSGSVDYIFSQAVLEHVRANEFLETMCELRRVLRPGGVCSHRVDLRDHLGGSLNNLRFSRRVWESSFFSDSGFYTNRIRFSEMNRLFQRAGFSVQIEHVDRWQKLPLPRNKLASEFRRFSDEDLTVSGFDVVLRPV